MDERRDLIDILTARQVSLVETDAEFARRLGVSRTMWQMCRTRQARPGYRVLRGALRAFPEYKPQVASFFTR